MFLRRLKDVTKKATFLRCIWDVLKTSQKRHLFWDVSKRSLRYLSQWRSDWYLTKTSHAGWVRVTSSNPRVTSSNPRISSSNPRVTSSDLQVTSSIPWIIKSMKTQVTSLKSSSFLKIVSPKLFGNLWDNSYILFLVIISCFTFPPLHGYGFSKKLSK